MSAGLVRGACPGLSAPMPTGDGLLVRLTPEGAMDIDAFVALCALALRHGNGVIEITARGNVQVRGLTAQSAPPFAEAVAELRIASTSPVPLVTDPLAGDPDALIDAGTIAAALTAALARSRLRLAPKVSIAIDGGGRLHLDAVPADIRLCAVIVGSKPRLHVALGGDAGSATTLGTIAPDEAADVVIGLLDVVAACGPAARAEDVLDRAGIAPFAAALPGRLEAALTLAPRLGAEPIGLHPLRDGTLALGVALAFGQADAEALSRLASAAHAHGACALRPALGRALLLIGLDPEGAEGAAAAARRLGFITRADDPRRRIAACAGKPACASAWLASRTLAAAVAPHLIAPDLPRHAGAIVLHISGCPKGCAHPAPAALTIVGDTRGAGLVRHGSAAATPLRHVGADDLVAEITQALRMSEADHG